MKKFLKDTKGAVTVFVTLLLIPAMLISGTAVDLARLHTARSIIQDANQLAANTVLSQYNSLLHDLYAIFGIAQDDPILGKLLDEYISVSVFGEPQTDRGLGTFQLFYGSDISTEEPYFPEGKNLRNPDVLRRQIEEYMKFRGPVIIVKEFLELIGMSTFASDVGVINDKLEVEEEIARILEKYKELYDAIEVADRCDQVNGGVVGISVGTVSSSLNLIRALFAALSENFSAWLEAQNSDEDDEEDEGEAEAEAEEDIDFEAIHNEILADIVTRTVGGRFQGSSGNPQGLDRTIANAIVNVDRFKPEFHRVVAIAAEVDGLKAHLSEMIDSLESRINSGEINEELKDALTEKTGSPAKSMIERYRDILKWDSIEAMANIFKDGGYYYLDEILKPYLDEVMYRSRRNPSGPSVTRQELANATSVSRLMLSESNSHTILTLGGYSQDADVSYKMPEGFLKFGDHPGDNQEFFKELEEFLNQPDVPLTRLFDGQSEASGADSEERQRNMISELKELVDSAYAGLKNDPLGAKHINSAGASSENAESMGDFNGLIKQTVNAPVTNIISDPAGSIARAGDYLLLLTYSMGMFSNYTTGRPEINGKSIDELNTAELPVTIAAIPLSPRVNYFFQSELEYLYNGSEKASANLSAITRLIFTVRLICNYITVFSVSEITTLVNNIRAAFSFKPPLGLLLGELARAAFVAAESAIDVSRLRAGYRVPLQKSVRNGEWFVRPSGVANALKSLAAGTFNNESDDNDNGLSYLNYMAFFFIAKAVFNPSAGDELIKRVGNLIEWNVVNYKNNINSNENRMSEALMREGRFKLEEMKTDFSLTTSVDMRMLFLSMIFAQDFSDTRAIGMPTRTPVSVTDFRGY
ncbi:MAG: DUF5702 domain-containing protein [Oscillospiraceae bacterium]|nr:DUF5702 domain-containing protein [Oscillospiraceae bacterium]MCL2278880.1 DUF5702 domain-containing protein [Oscillospiraceae bacterium]